MAKRSFVMCVDNRGYPASLEQRKLYVSIEDSRAGTLDQLRIVDESGTDYLYPAAMFECIDLPGPLEQTLLKLG